MDPTLLQDDHQGQDYRELRKLQSVFLAPRKVARAGGVEALLRSNNVHNTIYQSGKSPEARAWLDAVPKMEALTISPNEFRTAHATCSCGQDANVLGIHTQIEVSTQ